MSYFCSFSWNLDSSIWQSMKKVKKGEKFVSNIFSAFNCDFHLAYYPNGSVKEADSNAMLRCKLIRLPWNIHAISFHQTLIARNIAYRQTSNRSKINHSNNSHGWHSKDSLNKQIQLLNEEIYDCEIQLLAIYTSESHEIPVSEWQHYIGPQAKKNAIACFDWKINPQLWKQFISSEVNQSFTSPNFSKFNSKWYLQVYPSGTNANPGYFTVYLYLISSSFPNTIQKIECFMMVEIPQLNVRCTKSACNINLETSAKGIGFCMSSSRMESVQQVNIIFTIDILKIWDSESKIEVPREGWCMYIGDEAKNTNQNVNKNINNNSISSVLNFKEEKMENPGFELDMQLYSDLNARVSNIEMMIDSAKLNVDFMKSNMESMMNCMKSNIDSLTLNVNSLTLQLQEVSSNNSVNNKNKSSIEIFSQWLNSIGMNEYLVSFVSNGFDEIELVYELNDYDLLNDIGIKKKGHRIKYLRAMKELQMKNEGKNSGNNNSNAKVASDTKYL